MSTVKALEQGIKDFSALAEKQRWDTYQSRGGPKAEYKEKVHIMFNNFTTLKQLHIALKEAKVQEKRKQIKLVA